MIEPYHPTLILILLVYLSLLYMLTYRLLFSPLSKLPGPKYTLVTGLYLMYKEFRGERRLYIHELHQRYGSVVRLGPNEVSFTGGEALKEIYMAGGSGYDKTEFYTLFRQFSKRTMFSTLDKGTHSQKKRHIAGQYANTNVMRPEVIDGIQERADMFVKECFETKGESVDVYVLLHCYALDCASHFLLHPYGTHSLEEQEDRAMMEEQTYHDSLVENLAQYHFPKLSHLLEKILKPRPSPLANKYVLSTSQKSDLGEHTLAHKLQGAKGVFDDLQVAAECMDHLAAGIDTTGDALTFLLYTLSLPSNASIQARLRGELLSSASPTNSSSSSSTPPAPYLTAIIKESLRLSPPIPMSQPRYVPRGGRSIANYYLPGGTIVSAQAWSVGRLNEEVFPGGGEFRPERWLEVDGEGKEERIGQEERGGKEYGSENERLLEMNRLFFAFGAGARGCTGRHLALAEMTLLLQAIYTHFSTTIAPEMANHSMEMSDQIISSRPRDQICRLIFTPLST